MMDARLQRLSNMNDNTLVGVDLKDESGGLMDKFWKQSVPVFAGTEMEDNTNSVAYLKSLGKGTGEAISEKHEESSECQSSLDRKGDLNTPMNVDTLDQEIRHDYVTPDKNQLVDDSDAGSDGKDKKIGKTEK